MRALGIGKGLGKHRRGSFTPVGTSGPEDRPGPRDVAVRGLAVVLTTADSQDHGRMRVTRPVETPWTSHDSSLWFASEIAVGLMGVGPPRFAPQVTTPFPPLSPDSAYLASGGYELLEFRAPGDGTWMRDRGFFFATGGLGLALTAASAVARHARNSSRRSKALADATPRWLPVDRGHVYVAFRSMALRGIHGLAHIPSEPSCQRR
jgi:hypothetical protein